MTEAYDKGYRYALMEISRRYNPYEIGSVEYDDFNKGWDKSREDWA